ncbi:MAG: endonuclease NucS domain-containing protein, partial [Myxococcota bacterium]
MAGQVGIWTVGDGGASRLQPTTDFLEKDLERWIEQSPEVLPGGLTIVGRQLRTPSGPLDLLALDPQGRWVVVELKATRLTREVVTQAMDYAACIDEMPPEELERQVNEYLAARKGGSLAELMKERQGDEGDEPGSRDIRLLVAGVGRDPHLDRLLGFLDRRMGFHITQVSFELFELPSGGKVLLRAQREADSASAAPRNRTFTREAVTEMADRAGIGAQVREFVKVAEEAGLGVRPWKTSIMLTPPSNRTRCLITVWATRDKQNMRLYVAPEA